VPSRPFLLYSPLNQGLKLTGCRSSGIGYRVFTLQSIKSRIETYISQFFTFCVTEFLLYSPLNQGLKRRPKAKPKAKAKVFTLQSIKSRIETDH